MTDQLRVGIIGVGWGSMVQVPAFRAAGGYEVAALCSRRADRVAAAGARLGVEDVTTDWQRFVQRPDLDVISVCTPTDLHREQVLGAVGAGKHVLCEKPVALDSGQAAEMADAADAAGVATAVCFENRWGRGEAAGLAAGERRPARRALLRAGRHRGRLLPPAAPLMSEWMYRLADGGGYLLGMASHDIDYLYCLFGVPEAVCADVRATIRVRTRADGSAFEADADDTASLLLRWRSGRAGRAQPDHDGAAHRLPVPFRGVRQRRDRGDRRDAVRRDGAGRAGRRGRTARTAFSDAGGQRPRRHPRDRAAERADPGARAHARAVAAFGARLGGTVASADGSGAAPRVPTLRDGLVVQRVIDAARRSSDGAGWVSLLDDRVTGRLRDWAPAQCSRSVTGGDDVVAEQVALGLVQVTPP